MRMLKLGAALVAVLGGSSAFCAEVGTTAGGFSVGSSGSASYSIPIFVAPGIGGMAPSLSLSYDSSAGDSLAGRGADLAGLSEISRCPRTKADDGANKGVTLTQADAFCLDGQKLVAVNGVYGGVGTEYRTLMESFSKVLSYVAAR